VKSKSKKLSDLAALLYENKHRYSELITEETGKITLQANNEIDNCIKHLHFMKDNSERMVSN
jgi:acyl-CoA reductase-like NAD-dependent aldehyde dehydrogenase